MTWKKSQLRQNLNSPRLGDSACPLCKDAEIPNLTVHVSTHKTCGDVHLELSMLTRYQATCDAGQNQYREMCCPKHKQFPKVTVSVAAGLFLFWMFTRRLRSRRVRDETSDINDGRHGETASTSYKRMKDENRKKDTAKASSSKSKKSKKQLQPQRPEKQKSSKPKKERKKNKEPIDEISLVGGTTMAQITQVV